KNTSHWQNKGLATVFFFFVLVSSQIFFFFEFSLQISSPSPKPLLSSSLSLHQILQTAFSQTLTYGLGFLFVDSKGYELQFLHQIRYKG
ncbi:unnamed protein product, partial [Arabidopsis halleri]